ncbi:sensor histidine kinase [Parablautia muri]|uniref:histidine kinase n=1 Tax=Parablautia muri TaxID=2320879 RepID=A0A9X5GT06_9FIRM|nr:HAMP domain-containing sensor histidine kinase [Parablautia muri]NBJ94553.1 sensor histidine kinase [Parablautia muri]
MNVQKFFKRYVHSSVKLFCFFILVNIFLFVSLIIVSVSHGNQSPTHLLPCISDELQQTDGQYTLPDDIAALLDQDHAWCMLIDNATGNVIWNYKLPANIPVQYTYGDIAKMARWYLEDYPVFVSARNDGLLVLGYPKDSYWKLSAYKTIVSVKIDAIGYIAVFFLNIGIVLLLFIFNSRKTEKAVKPILIGIEEIAAGQKTQLAEQGELSEINAKLNHVSKTLKRRDTARANWISGISHDIRTPLSMILGYSSSLEKNHGLDSDVQEKMTEIRQQAEKIKRLIEDLNLTSKLEYDMQPLRISSIYPVELARQVICEFLDSNLDKKYVFEFESNPQCETEFIRGDEVLIKRAVTNLIQNSINHNANGCIITISVSCSEKAIAIVVSDNGVGVSAEKLKALNSKTHYMESTDKALHLRHGLGILLVRQIIEAHNGIMRILSEEQKGYETTLIFPKTKY